MTVLGKAAINTYKEDIMDSDLRMHLFLLSKIRETPRQFLLEKSLAFLTHFIQGYSYRHHVEEWEATTGLDFTMHCEETRHIPSTRAPEFAKFMRQFYRYVCLHYNQEFSSYSPMTIISMNSNSEEEAFDKYFELLDEFLKKRGIEYP